MRNYENGFSFVTITYNHENYILEHLESIVQIVKKFGSGRTIDLIIADDCSEDMTTAIVASWVEENYKYFRKIKTLFSEYNKGTITNLKTAISAVETYDFKFLAGDDKYILHDLFSLVDTLNETSIYVSPIIPFGNNYNREDFSFGYRALLYSIEKKKVNQLMKFDNYIQAPGVFYKGTLFRDKQLWTFLEPFKYIEDIPMWHYFLFVKGITVKNLDKAFVMYRINSGISSNNKNKKYDIYINELNKINNLLKIRKNILPKYLNPFVYLSKINRLIIKANKKHINDLFGKDNEIKKIYIY